MSNETIIREFINAARALKDGGLYKTAKEANVYTVKIQLEEFDQRDYPCTKFQEHTALTKLYLNASNSPQDHIKKAILLSQGSRRFQVQVQQKVCASLRSRQPKCR